MKRFIFGKVLALLVFLPLLCAPSAAATVDPMGFFNHSLGDFSEELEVAREEGKKGVLLFFEMDECPFCARMKASVLNQSDVQAFYREHFLIFDVDIEGDLEIVDFEGSPTTQKEFAKSCRVRATPVFAFYDLEGNQVVRYTGATSSKDEFLWLGEYAADAHYEDMKFTRYKRQKRREQKVQ